MFKYKVINNYFDEKDLIELTLIVNDPNNSQGLTDDGKVHIQLEKNFKDYLIKKYQNRWIKNLNELNPLKSKLFEYADMQVTLTGKNCVYPIHNDQIEKLLSGVVYLSPEKNLGTFIYDNKKNNKKEIEWEINKAFIFSRKDKDTWHSYMSDGLSIRCTVNFNLYTTNGNKVVIIDRGLIYFCLKKIRDFIFKN